MIVGTQVRGLKLMIVGMILHALAVAFGDVVFMRYGVGLLGGVALAWGCTVYLTGKGYPSVLGLLGFVFSVFWVGVCIIVPDRYVDEADLPPPPPNL